jgi:hypothetical protein
MTDKIATQLSEVQMLRAQIEAMAIDASLKPQVRQVQTQLGQWVADFEAATDGRSVRDQRLQMFQVEIGKQLRLLALDALFLQTAKQAATIESRQQQARAKINLLLQYCDGILALLDSQPK